MIPALLLLLALQGDPKIDKVERVIGDVGRPLLWAPLKVSMSSAAGFKGDLVARSAFGFSVAREVTLAPGGKLEVLLPSLDATELVAGPTTWTMPRPRLRPDFVVLVDARLPYADELVSDEKTLYQKVPAADLDALEAKGLLEAADRVARPGMTKEAALAPILARPASLELVDRAVWTLAPVAGWVPSKRSMTLYFAAVYAFAAFVGLAVTARRFPKFGVAAPALVALAGALGYLLLYPRGQVWIVEQGTEVQQPGGRALEQRVWFVQAASATETELTFPRLVKPLFSTPAGADDPFTIRVGDQGSKVEGLRLAVRSSVCFGGAALRAKPEGEGKELLSVVTVKGERTMSASGPLGEDFLSPEFKAYRRFLGGDGLYGLLWTGDRPSGDVSSPDLADARERPLQVIRRLP